MPSPILASTSNRLSISDNLWWSGAGILRPSRCDEELQLIIPQGRAQAALTSGLGGTARKTVFKAVPPRSLHHGVGRERPDHHEGGCARTTFAPLHLHPSQSKRPWSLTNPITAPHASHGQAAARITEGFRGIFRRGTSPVRGGPCRIGLMQNERDLCPWARGVPRSPSPPPP